MNWNPKWLLEHGLKPLTPAIITGAVILGCAHAPELQQLPALLSLDAESSVAEETPEPAPYGLSKAARPFNSRLDKSKLVKNGFTPLPTWQDATRRYVELLKKEV